MSASSQPIIASFDIGIKNMAYCVVEMGGDDGATPSNILAWGIINMVPETAAPPLCQATCAPPKKRGSGAGGAAHDVPFPCTARAAFTQNGAHYCKKHADKTRIIGAKDFAALKKKNIADLRAFCTARDIVVDFGALKTQIVENIQQQLLTRFFIPVAAAAPAKNAKEMDLISAGREMTRQLDRIFCDAAQPPLIGRITDVYIENQISTIAVRMKTLQGMLTQYFIMRAPEKVCIKYISATKKLKNAAAAPEAKSQKKEKTTYSERKKMGIEMCSKLLRESKSPDVAKWVTFFEGYGAKRDDLADALLQGIYG